MQEVIQLHYLLLYHYFTCLIRSSSIFIFVLVVQKRTSTEAGFGNIKIDGDDSDEETPDEVSMIIYGL